MSGSAIVSLQLPGGVGGFIELARDITEQTIDETEAAGLSTKRAREFLGEADAALAVPDYPQAYHLLRRASSVRS